MNFRLPVFVLLCAAVVTPAAAPASPSPVVNPTIAAVRDTEPVILKGRSFPGWTVPANQTAKLPLMDLAGSEACQTKIDISKVTPENLLGGLGGGGWDPTSGGVGIPDPSQPTGGAVSYTPDACPPQHYADPELDTARYTAGHVEGAPVDELLGYRWDAPRKRFRQIPFQVDEMFTRYLDNSRSGFALYSGQDQHTTYAFDREGFRWTETSKQDPCEAAPNSPVAKDPVVGLDSNDELAFMAEDAGEAAPADAPLPKGIEQAREVRVVDPLDKGKVRYAYVMKAAATGPRSAYNTDNGYVHYDRDPNADRFAFSESSYDSYGNAPKGPVCDANGNYVTDPKTGQVEQVQRRPLDTATITTKGYRFRYDGRWLMTKVNISPDNGHTYGPDLVDRWKARAFAQDPGSETPCCGYEEEDSNWGGSGITLGERVGPVRAIRETWGADSGTNVVRRETFYKREMRQKTYLRVHVIPPLDGIYAQWDFNAGRVDRFYNPRNSDKGVAIDGRNDEMYGNLDDPCNQRWDSDDKDALTKGYRQAYRSLGFGKYSLCNDFPYHQSVDVTDLSFSEANASLAWSMVTGDNGTIVDRTSADVEELSPGGAAQSVVAVPYYRDDSCFDDGTGSDPGPELHPRDFSGEVGTTAPDGSPRKCWRTADGVPPGDATYWQGSIATHGMHLLFVADSDNARQTIPTDEIVAETRMVMLPGRRDGDAGEQYGRGFEKPLVTAATPFGLNNGREQDETPGGSGGNGKGGGDQKAKEPTRTSDGSSSRPAPTPTAKQKAAAKRKRAAAKRKARRRCHLGVRHHKKVRLCWTVKRPASRK